MGTIYEKYFQERFPSKLEQVEYLISHRSDFQKLRENRKLQHLHSFLGFIFGNILHMVAMFYEKIYI